MTDRRTVISRLAWAGAGVALSGCGTLRSSALTQLRFGVVSDIHLTTPSSCRMLERTLTCLRRKGVDAVIVPGDITDWGLQSGLSYFMETWGRVFAGTETMPICCTGDHDYDGWKYKDMIPDIRVNGYGNEVPMTKLGMEKCWQETFGEQFAPVRVRTVKGFDFVCGEYRGYRENLGPWLAQNAGRLSGDRPFFYFQHEAIRGTTGDSFSWSDQGVVKPLLARFPNCVAFTGDRHTPFYDERQVWQGEFTVISVPSLCYSGLPSDYENGGGDKRDGSSTLSMRPIPMRETFCGGQGFLVSVYSDELIVERLDFAEGGVEAAPAWIVPLPAGRSKALLENVRTAAEPVPMFPAGAILDVATCNTENRQGKWIIGLVCEFPSALMPNGSRVHDYEVRVRDRTGAVVLTKRYLSPSFAKMAKHELAQQRFLLDAAELPVSGKLLIEVVARNCFGKASKPLVGGLQGRTK